MKTEITDNQNTPASGSDVPTCSACPICGEPLWFYDCWRSCPKCNLEIPDSLEDRIEKAKNDEWGLYAFYGRLDELKGRRVKPAQDAKHPNFTEDEHVIVSEIHPPNSVRISYLDGFSVGLRGLSELNLSSLPNDIGHPRRRVKPEFKQELYRRWMSWLVRILALIGGW